MDSARKGIAYPLKILIVEDDFDGRRLLQRILSPYGECDVAVNGKEALVAYEKSLNEEFSYDLICLDLLLPEMDGNEALRRIRQLEDSKGIFGEQCVKIIITTAIDDRRTMLNAHQTGCEGYLTKPIDRKKLLDTINGLGLFR